MLSAVQRDQARRGRCSSGWSLASPYCRSRPARCTGRTAGRAPGQSRSPRPLAACSAASTAAPARPRSRRIQQRSRTRADRPRAASLKSIDPAGERPAPARHRPARCSDARTVVVREDQLAAARTLPPASVVQDRAPSTCGAVIEPRGARSSGCRRTTAWRPAIHSSHAGRRSAGSAPGPSRDPTAIDCDLGAGTPAQQPRRFRTAPRAGGPSIGSAHRVGATAVPISLPGRPARPLGQANSGRGIGSVETRPTIVQRTGPRQVAHRPPAGYGRAR